MITKKILFRLAMGLICFSPLSVSADQLLSGNVIVGAEKAAKYDCTAPTLPFNSSFSGTLKVDPDASTGTFGSGEAVTVPTAILNTCDLNSGPPYTCEFTCEPVAATLSACVGQDCVNNESFISDTLKVKENNLRIRFHDTSIAGDGLGPSWNVEANSSKNGGLNYFGFQVKSVIKDSTVYSDGTAWPLYDCSATEIDPTVSPTAVIDQACLGDSPPSDCASRGNSAYIPAGQPIIEVDQTVENIDGQDVYTYACIERLDYTTVPVLALGEGSPSSLPDEPTFEDGIAIGYNSATEFDVVSVGRDDLMRRIVKVAKGIASTNALTKEGLEVEGTAAQRKAALVAWLAEADTKLDNIEIGIALLESGPPADPNDIDGDGIANDMDNCISTPNPTQQDIDNDNIGNGCDEGDTDGDGFSDQEETICDSDPANKHSRCIIALPWLMNLLGK